MNEHKQCGILGLTRRHFTGALAFAAAASRLGVAHATPGIANQPTEPDVHHIDAGLLNIAYAEFGPAGGPAIILLHGWPYDVHSFAEAAPLLAQAGLRVIVPYLRGYGATRFRAPAAMRNGQQAALALDVIALMDALNIRRAILAGFRLGRAHGRYRCSPVAGAMRGPGFRERLPDR